MVSQGFFSGSESANKRRFAGEKENKVALGGDNLGGYGALGIAGSVFGLGIKGIQSAVEGGKRLKENIEKRVNPERETSFFSPSGIEVGKVASSDLSSLKVDSPEIRIANVKSYTDSVTKPYAPDILDRIIKDTEFPSPTYTDSSGDIYTKKPYTESTPGYKFYNVPDAQLIRKKGDDPNFSQQYSTASDRENFIKERNAYLKDIGRPIPRDPNKDFEGKPLKTITGPLGLIKSGLLFRKGFQDEGAKEYASIMDKDASYVYKEYRKDMRDKVFSESPYGQDVEKKYYYKDFQKPGVYRSEDDVKNYIKDRGAFMTGMPSNFEGGISGRGEKSDDLSSMYRSTAGDEKTRLQKAREEQENRNVFQKVGDFVGNTFNKLTGTEAAAAGTLQAQGINTSATTNISQMGNVSPTVQAARDAVAKAKLRKSGLDRTIGGQSSQANYGRASRGFGTGTHGKGMSSNPGSQRQTGVGKTAGNLSRHKAGHSSSQPSSSKSRSQGRGGRRGGSSGGSGSSSKGGTGKGQSRSGGTTGRKASKASRSRTGRSRSQCDIRTKIDISPLINSNLVKDNLAEVAYFVQEIKK